MQSNQEVIKAVYASIDASAFDQVSDHVAGTTAASVSEIELTILNMFDEGLLIHDRDYNVRKVNKG